MHRGYTAHRNDQLGQEWEVDRISHALELHDMDETILYLQMQHRQAIEPVALLMLKKAALEKKDAEAKLIVGKDPAKLCVHHIQTRGRKETITT